LRLTLMAEREIQIINKLGLHARASAKLTQTASQYASEVWLARNGRRVNGKSIMGVMMLAASKGSQIRIETIGADEEVAMNALVALIEDKFGEGE
jgi:phosphocarrier protein HPr